MTGASWYAGVRVGPPETRRYVQDERYFAKEHMDVRREAFQARTAFNVSEITSLLATVSGGPTHTPAQFCGALNPVNPVGESSSAAYDYQVKKEKALVSSGAALSYMKLQSQNYLSTCCSTAQTVEGFGVAFQGPGFCDAWF